MHWAPHLHHRLVALLLLLAAAAVPARGIYVTFYSASNTLLVLRHCYYQLYAAPYNASTGVTTADKMWEVVRPPFNSTAPSDYIGLRSANYIDSYLCIDSSTNAAVAQVPTKDVSKYCTFRKVSGLSDSNFISLEQGGKYLALAGTLQGTCAASWRYFSSPSSDIALVASPVAAAATWLMVSTPQVNIFSVALSTYAIRHCYWLGYASTADTTDDDFRWIVESGMSSSAGVDGITLRSTNYPAYCLGYNGSHVLPMSTCNKAPKNCTFIKSVNGTASGRVNLQHFMTGKYLSLSSTITGPCSSWWSGRDLSLSSTPYAWSINGATLDMGQTSQINVTSTAVAKKVSPLLYGSFFEEINFAGEGGLYAELIRNRDFEAQGRGILGVGTVGTNTTIAGDIRPWTATISEGNASVTTDTSGNYSSTNPVALKIQPMTDDQYSVELVNPGFWGIKCSSGLVFNGSFYARTSYAASLTLRLLDSTSKAVVSTESVVNLTSSGKWKKYTFSLMGTSSATAEFMAVVETDAGATVWLDSISLFPGDAVMGLFRKDLFDLLAALKPAFLRFPGGNYLEGYHSDTRWNWKKTLGDVATRPGHYNDAWGYWSTDGLGVHEYFLLCEALGAKPVFSVFTGYLLSGKYIDMALSDFLRDPVDALEYANGNSSTTWGKLRVQNGHENPFGLDMFEVGNEEALMAEYKKRYNNITQALWSASNVTVIASGSWGASLIGGPCTSGSRCDMWDEHYYMTADAMASAVSQYDSYDLKTYPPVFVGEYAASNGWVQTIQTAVAEAAFMIGFERNADVVKMSSFAPLFGNTNSMQWSFVEINYNATTYFLNPFYHVQKMFVESPCTHTVSSASTSLQAVVVCMSGNDKTNSTMVIKIANYAAKAQLTTLQLSALENRSYTGSMTVISSFGPTTVNTLDLPDRVSPTTTTITAKQKMALYVPGWSVVVIRVYGVNQTAVKSSSSSSLLSSSSAFESTIVNYHSSGSEERASEAENKSKSSSETTDACLQYTECSRCIHTSWQCGWCTSMGQCLTSSNGDPPSKCSTSHWKIDSCSTQTSSTAAIVGGVVGGFCAACACAVVITFVVVSRNNKKKAAPNMPLDYKSVEFIVTTESGAPSDPTPVATVVMGGQSVVTGSHSSSGSSNRDSGLQLDLGILGLPSGQIATDINLASMQSGGAPFVLPMQMQLPQISTSSDSGSAAGALPITPFNFQLALPEFEGAPEQPQPDSQVL